MNKYSTEKANINGVVHNVETIDISDQEGRSAMAFHNFNDGEGVYVGVSDPRVCKDTAVVAVTREDARALCAQLIAWGFAEGSLPA